MAVEREYPLLHLAAGPLHAGLREELMPRIEAFQCLDFEAAGKAKAWLETNVSANVLPLDTYVVLSEDERDLFGFFVLDHLNIKVAPADVPIMETRKAIEDRDAETQRAAKLVWIARSAASDPGLGHELFEYALHEAEEAKACALMVEPYDEATATQLWEKHYHLRKPRDGAEDWTCLWHAVGQADQTFG